MAGRDGFPLPPSDAFKKPNSRGGGKMRSSRCHVKAHDPFGTLVKAGADQEELERLRGYVYLMSAVEVNKAKKHRMNVDLEHAEKECRRRTLGRLRKLAKEIEDLISKPEFDPRRLLPPSEVKRPLREAISEADKYSGIRALVWEWVKLPRSLYGFAAYLEIQFRNLRSRRTRLGTSRQRAVIGLLDYVTKATGRPHYREVADLVNEGLNLVGVSKNLGVDDLKKLSSRNPSLRQPPPKLF
jgi:hypothetical protein